MWPGILQIRSIRSEFLVPLDLPSVASMSSRKRPAVPPTWFHLDGWTKLDSVWSGCLAARWFCSETVPGLKPLQERPPDSMSQAGAAESKDAVSERREKEGLVGYLAACSSPPLGLGARQVVVLSVHLESPCRFPRRCTRTTQGPKPQQ